MSEPTVESLKGEIGQLRDELTEVRQLNDDQAKMLIALSCLACGFFIAVAIFLGERHA